MLPLCVGNMTQVHYFAVAKQILKIKKNQNFDKEHGNVARVTHTGDFIRSIPSRTDSHLKDLGFSRLKTESHGLASNIWVTISSMI